MQGAFTSQEDSLPTYTFLCLRFGHPSLLPPHSLQFNSQWPAIVHPAPPFQYPACCNFLHIVSVPGPLLFLSLFHRMTSPRLKKLVHSFLNTDAGSASKLSSALPESQHLPTSWTEDSTGEGISSYETISSTSEWVRSTGNTHSRLQLAAVTPHELTVCSWECGSSSWHLERFSDSSSIMQTHTGVMWKLPSHSSFGTDPDASFLDTVSTSCQKRTQVHVAHISEKIIHDDNWHERIIKLSHHKNAKIFSHKTCSHKEDTPLTELSRLQLTIGRLYQL